VHCLGCVCGGWARNATRFFEQVDVGQVRHAAAQRNLGLDEIWEELENLREGLRLGRKERGLGLNYGCSG
jgi:hypothetical protein